MTCFTWDSSELDSGSTMIGSSNFFPYKKTSNSTEKLKLLSPGFIYFLYYSIWVYFIMPAVIKRVGEFLYFFLYELLYFLNLNFLGDWRELINYLLIFLHIR